MDYNNNYNAANEEFEWDSVISEESSFTLLPEGEYPFTIINLERSRHNGSEKLPPCNKAILTLDVDGGNFGKVTLKKQLFLARKAEGILSSFFLCIGRKKHGEPLRMDWSNLIGVTGLCKVGIYKSKNDNRDYNEIKSFVEPKDSAQAGAPAAAPAYNPPKYAPPRG